MSEPWSRPVVRGDPDDSDYWDYFGARLVAHADIHPGKKVLDVGCGSGSSLFPAGEKILPHGFAVGIDICPH